MHFVEAHETLLVFRDGRWFFRCGEPGCGYVLQVAPEVEVVQSAADPRVAHWGSSSGLEIGMVRIKKVEIKKGA